MAQFRTSFSQVDLLFYYLFLFTLLSAVYLSFLNPELEATELEINKIYKEIGGWVCPGSLIQSHESRPQPPSQNPMI